MNRRPAEPDLPGWSTRHPQTLVLSADTGHSRNYRRNPYEQYFTHPELKFPVSPTSDRLPVKSRVLGVWIGESAAKAYPLSVFNDERTELQDEIDGHYLTLAYNPEAQSVRVVEAEEGIEWMYSLWFAWYAFHPDTEIYSP